MRGLRIAVEVARTPPASRWSTRRVLMLAWWPRNSRTARSRGAGAQRSLGCPWGQLDGEGLLSQVSVALGCDVSVLVGENSGCKTQRDRRVAAIDRPCRRRRNLDVGRDDVFRRACSERVVPQAFVGQRRCGHVEESSSSRP